MNIWGQEEVTLHGLQIRPCPPFIRIQQCHLHCRWEDGRVFYKLTLGGEQYLIVHERVIRPSEYNRKLRDTRNLRYTMHDGRQVNLFVCHALGPRKRMESGVLLTEEDASRFTERLVTLDDPTALGRELGALGVPSDTLDKSIEFVFQEVEPIDTSIPA